MEQETPDPKFDAITNRLLRREALRRAAEELNTTSGPGLESVLERVSAEVTAEALDKRALDKRGGEAAQSCDGIIAEPAPTRRPEPTRPPG